MFRVPGLQYRDHGFKSIVNHYLGWFSSPAMFVNSQLVHFLQVGIFFTFVKVCFYFLLVLFPEGKQNNGMLYITVRCTRLYDSPHLALSSKA